MAENIISSDHPLTTGQQAALAALLDTLVPASDDGRLPGASDMDFIAHLGAQAPDFLPVLTGILDAFDESFAAASYEDRYGIVDAYRAREPGLFNACLFQVYACYYQDDRVLEGIGAKPGAPFPEGNDLATGDLSLLDPVVKLGRSYRK